LPYDNYKWWIFQYSFAATSATIVSGALAERCQLATYLCFSLFMTSFIYPVVCAWIWADGHHGIGWLNYLGFIDFAGSGVVHLVGGICAIWGARTLGERYGKDRVRKIQEAMKRGETIEDVDHSVGVAGRNSIHWDDHEFKEVLKHVKGDYKEAFKEWVSIQQPEFKAHNPALIVTGTLLLWVCWLFFNGGSAAMFATRRNGPAKVVMINVVSASAGGLFAVFFKPRITGTYSFVSQYDAGTICNGIIVGLVSCTASCD
jgi:ammonium transporter, Amt family